MSDYSASQLDYLDAVQVISLIFLALVKDSGGLTCATVHAENVLPRMEFPTAHRRLPKHHKI